MTTPLNPLATKIFESPVGNIYLTGDKYHLYKCSFNKPDLLIPDDNSPILETAATQLREYFAGSRRSFDLPISMNASAFFMKVWMILRQIEYANTTTYKEISELLRLKNGARAVGRAASENPLLIIIPCHRVLGENGSLTGYAGGKDVKRFLLNFERDHSTLKPDNLLF
ncbi:MAG: methylated-DNA--[protein]-cysteine S-methyltransferase [Bacteroidales bacterium]